MANDATVTASMPVKPEQLETLLSMIPDHQRETLGGPGADNAGHRSCEPPGGREPMTFRAFVESHRADLTPGA